MRGKSEEEGKVKQIKSSNVDSRIRRVYLKWMKQVASCQPGILTY